MTTPIFTQGVSFFDTSTQDPNGLIPLQTDSAGAQISGVERVTNMLIPDAPTSQQLVNFSEYSYDLRDTSVIVRLMRAFLGDSGVGQLRKRALVTRLESYLTGANFFDLDRFYGAIFGALRTPAETLSINPMNSTATPDEWDSLLAADASYRERISNLAQAIEMGGTVSGLKRAAEAIVQTDVDIYESWQLLDAYGAYVNPNPNTWDEVEGLWPTWDSFDPTATWNEVEGTVVVGRTNSLTRSEIVIRPKKEYATDPDNAYDFAQDQAALVRVLDKIRPAGTIVTVDPTMGNPHYATPIAGLVADSEYWQIISKVTPLPPLITTYPLSTGQISSGVQAADQRTLPVPPFSGSGGKAWSYNAVVSSVKSYSFPAVVPSDMVNPQDGPPSSTTDDQTVVYRDGTTIQYTAQKGVQSSQLACAALTVADGSLVAHPYTADRKAVPVHE